MSELIAETEAKPGLEGSGPVGDVLHLGHDLFGDGTGWEGLVDGGLCAIDLLLYCENPLNALLSAGVGWLLEHIPGISDVWDKLTGDSVAIEQIAATWENISEALKQSQTAYSTSSGQITQWSGPAAGSYAKVSEAYATALAGGATEAQALAIVVKLVGGLVAGTKDMIYTIIGEFIEFTVLPAILGAIATAWCTFGGSIAVAITYIEIQADITAVQITVQITRTTERIIVISERAMRVVGKMATMERALGGLAKELRENRDVGLEIVKALTHGEVEQAR
ncbi:MAG: hypothetical protein ABI775_14110 [Pseudonocardiales bacterium]